MLTFRKEKKETGLRAVGTPYPNTMIKHKKKVVGLIVAPTWQTKDNCWVIRLAVKEIDPLLPQQNKWKWVAVKRRFDSEPQAREYIRDRRKEIEAMPLHYFDDWE